MEKLYGADHAEMLATLNVQDLKEEVQALNADGHAADTRLKLNLAGRNPDEGVTSIAYNKGYLLLRTIEALHGREHFDAFIKHYFAANAFQATDTEFFIKFIKDFYQQHGIALNDSLLERWIYQPGIPDDYPAPQAKLFTAVDDVLKQWHAAHHINPQVTSQWSTQEWLYFLRNLPQPLNRQLMQQLDNAFHFTASGNAEILTVWLTLAIRYQYNEAYARLADFMIHTGRRKFLSPLYNELAKTPEGLATAKKIYTQARPNYHFVATNTFDALLAQ